MQGSSAVKRLWLAAICVMIVGACGGRGPVTAVPGTTSPRLAEVPVTAAEQARAAEMLAEAREALDDGNYAVARAIAEEIVSDMPGTTSSVPALWVAAQAAQRAGDYLAAAAHAERYASVYPEGSPQRRQGLEMATQARSMVPERLTGVLGAILPQTGSPVLTQYAELILEGIRIGVDRFNTETGAEIELVVLDDAGDTERASALVRELEGRGAFGVIGPLLAPSIVSAARARSSPDLAIVSPLEDVTPWGLENVVSLGSVDTRGAEALAQYAVSIGLDRIGVLYPRMREFELQAAAFIEALRAAGGQVVANVPYDSGTTTFAQPLVQLRAASPAAVFVPAPVRDIRQLAPQFEYYGLKGDSLQILGSEEWAAEELLRVIEPQHVEGVIAATPFLSGSDALAWDEFVGWYENTYRRSLANAVPALAYDATRLVLEAIAGDTRPASVSSRMRNLNAIRGATGILTVRDGYVERRPFLVRIESRVPVPIRAAGGG